jgi:hypothetical protein
MVPLLFILASIPYALEGGRSSKVSELLSISTLILKQYMMEAGLKPKTIKDKRDMKKTGFYRQVFGICKWSFI